jgi:hypothetical protein
VKAGTTDDWMRETFNIAFDDVCGQPPRSGAVALAFGMAESTAAAAVDHAAVGLWDSTQIISGQWLDEATAHDRIYSMAIIGGSAGR